MLQYRHSFIHYPNKRFLDYLQFGFPVTCDHTVFKLDDKAVNHAFGLAFMDTVDRYFWVETRLRAMADPYKNKPIEILHISVLKLRYPTVNHIVEII